MNSYILLGIVGVVFLLIIILIFSISNRKRKSKRNRNYHSIRSKEYKKEIYNNTPEEYQQSIRYLYNRLEQLDEVMVRNNRSLNAQSEQAVKDILRRAAEAEKEINQYWELSKKKADFYYYIGLHYTSFTLADKLTEELESLRKINGMLSDGINRTQSQINRLKGKIDDANTVANIGQVKKEHQELCRKCDALRKTRKICVEQMEDCKKCRDKQNVITAQRRDYIGKNFGKKGKQWRNRIMAKHKR